MERIKTYFKSILVPVLVGGVVGWLISSSIDYNSLIKPPLAPSSKVFPVMWTILYILMGISYGMLKENELVDKDISIVYYLQLGVNALWSIFFFVLKWRLFSGVWILLLALLVAIMVYKFYEKYKTAGLIQIPYLLWTLFATYLNFGIWFLNK